MATRLVHDEARRAVAHEEREREIARGRFTALTLRVIRYVFYAIYALILIEIALEAAGAREGNAFKEAMDSLSAPFLGPFRGLFADPVVGDHRLMFSYLAALVVWMLVHLAIRGIVLLIAQRHRP